jgi:hypothetical protein
MKTYAMPNIFELIPDYTPQPDCKTCQSACIAQMLGLSSASDVFRIRQELIDIPLLSLSEK